MIADYFSRVIPDVYSNEQVTDVIASVLATYQDELMKGVGGVELKIGSVNKVDVPELKHINICQKRDQ